jgi:glutamine synthetase
MEDQMDKKDLLKRAKEDGVKFISYQFTDVTGSVKSVDGPIQQFESALDSGIWFDGSSVEGFTRIQESDMRLVVDPGSYAVLPWTPAELKRARMFCDIFLPNGQPFPGDPRGVL